MSDPVNEHITIEEKTISKCKHHKTVFEKCEACAKTYDSKFKKSASEIERDECEKRLKR